MGALAVFGINNDGLNLVVNLLLLFLFVLYFALIYWTYSDARRRITDPMLVGCATAASLFPYIGTIVYMIVRPPEYLEDMHERELEIAAAEARLSSARELTCPYCDFEVEKAFLRCPSCLRRLKEPCTVCGKPLDPRWRICPYCEAEVGQAPAQPRRRERTTSRPATAGGGRAATAQRSSSARTAKSAQNDRPAEPETSPPADGTGERPAREPTRPPATGS
jgi:double zinc ribbon protein